jgi:hypothetical protein
MWRRRRRRRRRENNFGNVYLGIARAGHSVG